VSTTRADVQAGRYLARDKRSFADYADTWADQRARRVRRVSAEGYRACLVLPKQLFGRKGLADITRQDVQGVMVALTDRGRSRRTAQLHLFVLRSVFADAIADGLVVRDPCVRVEAHGREPQVRGAMLPEDMVRLRDYMTGDRLAGCWWLTLAGLLCSEVMALRWSDVDFAEQTITIVRGRVAVDGKVSEEGDPKTRRGRRTVHVTDDLRAILRRMRDEQGAQFGFEHARNGRLAVNEAGEDLRPERYSDLWREACLAAGVPVCTLHAARHSSVTLMRKLGVPDQIVAAHHGHDESTMRATYSHAHREDLVSAAELLEAAMRTQSSRADVTLS
jgi:integrase